MAGDQKGEFSKDYIKGNIRNNFADQKLKIPLFFGDPDPAAYVKWEEKIELFFSCQHYAERKKVQMATAEFCSYASSWWNHLIRIRRLRGKESVETWHKLRTLMRREFIPRQYHKEVIRKQSEIKTCSANSVQKQQGNLRSSPTSVISLSSKKTSRTSKEDIKELSQLSMDVGKPLKPTNTTRPFIEAQNQEPFLFLSQETQELEDERGNNTYEEKEVSDSSHCLKDHEETNLLRNYECSHHSFHSDFLLENTQACDELTCLEPVQPSSVLSLTQLAEKDSSEKEPEQSTQGEELEQQKICSLKQLMNPCLMTCKSTIKDSLEKMVK